MSIRDIDPGYLDRQGLLAEHRELHGIVTVLARGNKGNAGRPEISRWSGYGWALRQRHRLLVCEEKPIGSVFEYSAISCTHCFDLTVQISERYPMSGSDVSADSLGTHAVLLGFTSTREILSIASCSVNACGYRNIQAGFRTNFCPPG